MDGVASTQAERSSDCFQVVIGTKPEFRVGAIGLHDGNDHDDNTMPWQARHTEAQLKRGSGMLALQAGRHYRENPSFRKAVEVQTAQQERDPLLEHWILAI